MHILNNLLLVGGSAFFLFLFKYYLVILKLVPYNITNILICHLFHVNVFSCLGYLMEMTECMSIVLLII